MFRLCIKKARLYMKKAVTFTIAKCWTNGGLKNVDTGFFKSRTDKMWPKNSVEIIDPASRGEAYMTS